MQSRFGHSDTAKVPVDDTRRVGRPASAEPDEDTLPRRVGRFSIIRLLGRGGMGMVLSAYDEELDRQVAIKLLKPDLGASAPPDLLVREAQALAKLSHPNVVQVYEVGMHQGGVFIAMEFIAGDTLSRWRRRPDIGFADVLRCFVQAGEGLAAAHAVELVHRDFKPANVMVGRDGRVRVLDFGIASVHAEYEGTSRGTTLSGSGSSDAVEVDATQRLTSFGTVMGTPAYMAPEQHCGRSTAQSDQFSFCVALFETLYGERPYGRSRYHELATGTRLQFPRSKVPNWIAPVLARGLALEPESRFASMAALLEALRADPSARRRRWATVGSISVLGIGALTSSMWGAARATPACADVDEGLRGVWDRARADRVKQAFADPSKPYLASSWLEVERTLIDYVDRWGAAWTDACQATLVRREQSSELMDLRMRCLAERRDDLDALLNALQTADATAAQWAVRAAHQLPSIEPCSDAEGLRSGSPRPTDPDALARVEAVEQLLRRARIHRTLGAFGEAVVVAEEAERASRQTEFEPIAAAANFELGRALADAGRYTQARDRLRTAYSVALRSRNDAIARDAAVRMAGITGAQLSEGDRADDWIEIAEAQIARAGDSKGAEGRLFEVRAAVARDRGELQRAYELQQRALSLLEEAFGSRDHVELLDSLRMLGFIARILGELEPARSHLDRALAIAEKRLGLDHPEVAEIMSAYGMLHLEAQDHIAAREAFEQGLAILEKGVGLQHPHAVALYINLGIVHTHQSRYEDALKVWHEAMRIVTATRGARNSTMATLLTNIGGVQVLLGRHAEAVPTLEQAIELRKSLGEGPHPDLGGALVNLGDALVGLGRPAEAIARYEEGRAIWTRIWKPDHPELVRLDLSHARALMASGTETTRVESLIAGAETAYARASDPVGTSDVAAVRAELAISRGDWAEAAEVAQRALSGLQRAKLDRTVEAAILRIALGRIALQERRFDVAQTELAIAVELLQAAGGPRDELARAEALLDEARKGTARSLRRSAAR